MYFTLHKYEICVFICKIPAILGLSTIKFQKSSQLLNNLHF